LGFRAFQKFREELRFVRRGIVLDPDRAVRKKTMALPLEPAQSTAQRWSVMQKVPILFNRFHLGPGLATRIHDHQFRSDNPYRNHRCGISTKDAIMPKQDKRFHAFLSKYT
jgi:hypothetical protein